MKLSINIPAGHLHAAVLCAAVNDVRFYLNSVAILPKPGGAWLCSTDGNTAFVHVMEGVDVAAPIIIPLSSVNATLVLAGKKAKFVGLDISEDGQHALGGVVFSPIDGRYPDVDRVIPRRCTGESTFIAPEYRIRGAKVVKACGGKPNLGGEVFAANGKAGPSVLVIDENTLFLATPVRDCDEQAKGRDYVLPGGFNS